MMVKNRLLKILLIAVLLFSFSGSTPLYNLGSFFDKLTLSPTASAWTWPGKATRVLADNGLPTYLPVVINSTTQSPPPPITTGLVADNSVVAQFSSIPGSAIQAAKAKKVLFYHQSTGGYISYSGLDC